MSKQSKERTNKESTQSSDPEKNLSSPRNYWVAWISNGASSNYWIAWIRQRSKQQALARLKLPQLWFCINIKLWISETKGKDSESKSTWTICSTSCWTVCWVPTIGTTSTGLAYK